MVGEDASASARAPEAFAFASESLMLRSVERELCAERGGDLI